MLGKEWAVAVNLPYYPPGHRRVAGDPGVRTARPSLRGGITREAAGRAGRRPTARGAAPTAS